MPASEWPFGEAERGRLDLDDLREPARCRVHPRPPRGVSRHEFSTTSARALSRRRAGDRRSAPPKQEWERVLSSREGAEEDVYAEPSAASDRSRELDATRTVASGVARASSPSPGRRRTIFRRRFFRRSGGASPTFSPRCSRTSRPRRARPGLRLRLRAWPTVSVELFAEAGLSAGRETRSRAKTEAPARRARARRTSRRVSSSPSSRSRSSPPATFSRSPRAPTPSRGEAPALSLRLSRPRARRLRRSHRARHRCLPGLEAARRRRFETELVVLEYRGGDKLYVPVDRLDYLEKYSSAESASSPGSTSSAGTGWERVKKRVRKSMRDMAQELLKLYAAAKVRASDTPFRRTRRGCASSRRCSSSTRRPDQLQAIDDVKRDMESPSPMDRLVCGDVGYGKTEVAMRAAFKAVSDGKQVAVLVPTTVLAFQHLSTFQERFAPFPVRVEMLSRFRSRRRAEARSSPSSPRERSTSSSAPIACSRRTSTFSRSRAPRRRRGAALRRRAQGAARRSFATGSTRSR